MARASIIRVSAGVCLVAVGVLAGVGFSVYQGLLSGLSADGVVQAQSWLALRILLLGCILPGIVLVLLEPLRGVLEKAQAVVAGADGGRFLTIVLGAAVVLRLAAVAIMPLHQFADAASYDRLAQLWAIHGTYTDGYGPTAFWPPGYPFFLSRLYLIFGHAPQLAVLGNVIMSIGIVYLAYRLARIALDEVTARWTAVILAVFPSQILFANVTGSEVLFTFLLLLGLSDWFEGSGEAYGEKGVFNTTLRGDGSVWFWVSAALAGLLLGWATHVRTVALLVPLLLVIAGLGRSTLNLRWWLRWMVLVVVMAIVLVPWVIRNYHEVGRATLATNGGFNFYVGNNPNSAMGYNQPDTTILYQRSSADEAHDDSLGYALGWQYIREEPLAFVQRGILKAGFVLLSDTEALAYHLTESAEAGRFDRYAWLATGAQGFHLAFLLAFIGGVVASFRKWPMSVAARLFLTTVVYWLIVHAVYFGDGRYRFPIVPLMAGFAAVGIIQMTKRRRNSE